jgi:hypothetical protein
MPILTRCLPDLGTDGEIKRLKRMTSQRNEAQS